MPGVAKTPDRESQYLPANVGRKHQEPDDGFPRPEVTVQGAVKGTESATLVGSEYEISDGIYQDWQDDQSNQ